MTQRTTCQLDNQTNETIAEPNSHKRAETLNLSVLKKKGEISQFTKSL